MMLNVRTVADRVQSFTRDQYIFSYGIMKNIALATAGVVLLTLSEEPETFIPRLAFWLASVGAILVTHSTAARGMLLAGYRYTLLDSLLPLTHGLIEFLLFAVLAPLKHRTGLWQYWLLLFGLHGICAMILVLNRLACTTVQDCEAILSPLVEDLLRWLKRDWKGAGACGVAYVAAWTLMHFWIVPVFPWWAKGETVLGMHGMVVMILVWIRAEKERSYIAKVILALEA